MVVADQLGPLGTRQAETFFRRADMALDPVTLEQSEPARQACLDFGKSRHRAGLRSLFQRSGKGHGGAIAL